MIQDQINLCHSLNSLRLRCYACHETGHLINDCKILHYYPDKEKTIKCSEFSYPQPRVNFLRTKKKERFKVTKYKKMKISKLKTKNIDFDSSDEDLSSDERYDKDKNKILSKELSNVSCKSDKWVTQASGSDRKISLFEKTKSKSRLIPENIALNDRKSVNYQDNNIITNGIIFSNNEGDANMPRISLIPSNIQPINEVNSPRARGKSIPKNPQFTRNSILNKINTETPKQTDIIFSFEDEMYLMLKPSLEEFDKIQNFQFYFPNHNFSEIQPIYNDKNPWLKMHKKKRIQLQRLSQYTIKAIHLYNKIKGEGGSHHKTRCKTVKKTKINGKSVFYKSVFDNGEDSIVKVTGNKFIDVFKAHEPVKRMRKQTFSDLVKTITKLQRERRKKKKWVRFKEFIRKIRVLFKI